LILFFDLFPFLVGGGICLFLITKNEVVGRYCLRSLNFYNLLFWYLRRDFIRMMFCGYRSGSGLLTTKDPGVDSNVSLSFSFITELRWELKIDRLLMLTAKILYELNNSLLKIFPRIAKSGIAKF